MIQRLHTLAFELAYFSENIKYLSLRTHHRQTLDICAAEWPFGNFEYQQNDTATKLCRTFIGSQRSSTCYLVLFYWGLSMGT